MQPFNGKINIDEIKNRQINMRKSYINQMKLWNELISFNDYEITDEDVRKAIEDETEPIGGIHT